MHVYNFSHDCFRFIVQRDTRRDFTFIIDPFQSTNQSDNNIEAMENFEDENDARDEEDASPKRDESQRSTRKRWTKQTVYRSRHILGLKGLDAPAEARRFDINKVIKPKKDAGDIARDESEYIDYARSDRVSSDYADRPNSSSLKYGGFSDDNSNEPRSDISRSSSEPSYESSSSTSERYDSPSPGRRKEPESWRFDDTDPRRYKDRSPSRRYSYDDSIVSEARQRTMGTSNMHGSRRQGNDPNPNVGKCVEALCRGQSRCVEKLCRGQSRWLVVSFAVSFALFMVVGILVLTTGDNVRPLSQSLSRSQAPTQKPSLQPSLNPTNLASSMPTTQPSNAPITAAPSAPTQKPSLQPSLNPTNWPSSMPTVQPSNSPVTTPSTTPSNAPSSIPSSLPTVSPTYLPSSMSPTKSPTVVPSISSMPSNDYEWDESRNRLLGQTGGQVAYGYSVALSKDGNTMAVLIALFNEVEIYDNINGTWTQRGDTLLGFTHSADTLDISGNGDVVAIGGPAANNFAGIVRVFRWNGGNWKKMGQDLNADFNQPSDFGCSVALSASGLDMVVGARTFDFLDRSGRATVFAFDGYDWVQRGSSYTGYLRDGVAFFAESISITDDGMYYGLGAPFGFTGELGDYALVFKWDGNDWVQVGRKLQLDPPSSAFDEYGASVKLIQLPSGSLVVAVGIARYNRKGQIRVYDHLNDGNSGTDWIERSDRINSPSSSFLLGYSMALSDDGNTIAAVSHKQTLAYDWDGLIWIQRGLVLDTPGDPSGSYETIMVIDMSSDGNIIVVGLPHDEDARQSGSNNGQVRTFEWRRPP